MCVQIQCFFKYYYFEMKCDQDISLSYSSITSTEQLYCYRPLCTVLKTPVTQYNASAPYCTCADIYCSNHTGLPLLSSLHISGTDPGTDDSSNLTNFGQLSNRLGYCESRSYYIYKHERLEAKPWTQHDFVLYYHPTQGQQVWKEAKPRGKQPVMVNSAL